MAAKRAEEIVAGAGGKLDLPQDLTLRIPALMVAEYFGTPGPSEKEMMDWTTIMFWYLFIDLQADPDTIAKAKEAARNCCAYLDKAIAERKANPTDADDVLNRCLEMQRAGIPGMDDLGIRNNMIGMLIGAIPTISKASWISCLIARTRLRSPRPPPARTMKRNWRLVCSRRSASTRSTR